MNGEVLPGAVELQRVLETISGGMLAVGTDERIAFCNREFCDYFGLPDGASTWIGLPSSAALDAVAEQMVDPVAFRRRAAELAGGTTTAFEHLEAADGRTFERDYLPMTDGAQHCGHVWHYWDVTEQHAADLDRERRLRAEIITQRLGMHAQRVRAAEAERTGLDLAERNRVLLETDLLRKELLATASHELRTPLTTILNFSEMLGDDAPDGSQTAQFTAAITRNAGRLLDLVDDLLLLARIGAGAPAPDLGTVDLSALVRLAVEDARAVGDGDGVKIAADLEPHVLVPGSADALARAVANVLGNAVKYSHHAGAIEVVLRRVGAEVELVVTDHGIGIPAQELGAVFGQFFRASTARESGRPGTGLGLPIVRSILEQHAGSVRVTSEVGVGTVARLVLPAA